MMDINDNLSKKVLDYYVEANENKNILSEEGELSKAEFCVLSCLDAMARYSENSDKINWDLSKVIRMIIMDSFEDQDRVFNNCSNGKIRNIYNEKKEFCSIESLASKISELMIANRNFENNSNIKSFITNYSRLHSINKKEYLLWGFSGEKVDSVLEHIYGCLVLALSLECESSYFINYDKLLMILLLHKTNELSLEDKKYIDASFDTLKMKEEYRSLVSAFDKKEFSSTESYYANLLDELEYDLQVGMYELNGLYSINSIPENTINSKEDIKQIIDNGALSVFDVVYELDKDRFISCPALRRVLDETKNYKRA